MAAGSWDADTWVDRHTDWLRDRYTETRVDSQKDRQTRGLVDRHRRTDKHTGEQRRMDGRTDRQADMWLTRPSVLEVWSSLCPPHSVCPANKKTKTSVPHLVSPLPQGPGWTGRQDQGNGGGWSLPGGLTGQSTGGQYWWRVPGTCSWRRQPCKQCSQPEYPDQEEPGKAARKRW